MRTDPAPPGDPGPYDAMPWLEHYPLDVPATIPYPEQSIWEVLEGTVGRYPSHEAFIFQNYPMSFREVLQHSRRMAAGLAAAGVGRGDVVLALLPNTPHFPITYYGTLKLGAALAAVSPASVEREIEFFIRDSGAKVIVTLDLLYDKIAGIWANCGVTDVVIGRVTDFMPAWVRMAAPYLKRVPKPKIPVEVTPAVHPMREFLRTAPQAPEVPVGPGDIGLLQYTGGTTGTPKAAMLTHRSLLINAHQMRAWLPQVREGKETILAVLPFFHVYGVTLALNAGLLLGARTLLIAGGWVPSEVFDAIKRYKPSIFPGVPTLYIAILNDERSRAVDLSSIDICISGGAPLPREVKRDFERLTDGYLLEGYGLTEASPLTHAQPADGTGKPGSIGMPVPDTRARIMDVETDQGVPVGEAGELVVRGPQVMAGYWRREEETRDVLRDGWLRTGDIARMDKDGTFYIVDRKKDLIITGGENIYPREIEEVLFEHPQVKEAAVVGIPHRFGGEIAKAFIVLKPRETASKKEILQFARERLAKHKVPRAVEFRDELPKSQSGKVLRRVLAEQEIAHRNEHIRGGREE